MANVDLFAATPEGAAQAQRAFGARSVSGIPSMIEEFANKEPVFIFNVGPWSHRVNTGTLFGTITITACAEGKTHSEPYVVKGMVIETYPLRENSLDPLMHKDPLVNDGFQIARDIIGIHARSRPSMNIGKYGVFISRSNPPKKSEIDAANKTLDTHCGTLVNEARSAAALGQKEMDETVRPDQHVWAAQRLKLDPATETWMRGAQVNAKREKCWACGSVYETGVIFCPNQHIVDQDAYKKAKVDGKL